MNHILDEDKKVGSFYAPPEGEDEKEPEFSPEKTLQAVTEKLKKINSLVEKELIGKEDFEIKKGALLEGSVPLIRSMPINI